MKEKYIAPELEIIKFLANDVIVTSLKEGEGEEPPVDDDDIWH